MSAKLLIIGITGGVGSAVAEAALNGGFQVRAMHRNPAKVCSGPNLTASSGLTRGPLADDARDPRVKPEDGKSLPSGIQLIQGDAMSADEVRRAAEGCQFILHAANPPGYRNWGKLVVPMARNAAEAARAVNARLLVPGNIYNFMPDQFPLIREGALQNPVSRKGRIRVEMEQALRASGARVTVLRAGDFFGPHAPSSWFQTVMVRPGKPLKSVTYPGPAGVGHAFAYLPDMAQTFVRLMQSEAAMQRFEDLHFAGHHVWDGHEFARRIARAANQVPERVKRLPWPMLMLAWPFVPLVREIAEMRYLWQLDAALDNQRLVGLIGPEPHTPLDEALRHSLTALGCVNAPLEAAGGAPIVRETPA